MPKRATQEKYAENLRHTDLGLAVYHPIEFRQRSGRVGDIGFFDENGKYQWIRNAFDAEVKS